MKKICRELAPPVLANMVEGGEILMLTTQGLENLGSSIASFPGSLQRSSFRPSLKILDSPKEDVWGKEV